MTLDDQLSRLDEELHYAATARPGWQRDECAINVYLLVCGIACTVDDYLGRRIWDLGFLARRFPQLRWAILTLRRLLGLAHVVRQRVRDGPVLRWRERWAACVDTACDTLVGAATLDGERWRELRSSCKTLRQTTLPPELRRRRLRLPEGFRCQDLSHHDVLALARRFAERRPEPRGPVAVIGVRTAGAYFAPLAKAYLATLGWVRVSWLTIRPRQELTAAEQRQLRMFARERARLLVIDDHPNTGATLAMTLAALQGCGVTPERITVVTPRHPVQPGWALPHDAPGADRVAVITLEPEETYKAQLLTPHAVAPLLRDWFGTQGWQHVVVSTSRQVDAINAQLAEHGRDGFQVRLQRLFEVQLARDTEDAIVIHVVAKSVGWGWLGYHAYLAGTRLGNFVPPLIGIRHGLLFSQWVGDITPPATNPPTSVPVATLAAYVARRARCLPLTEDPRLLSHDSSSDGWTLLLAVLRRVYGPFVGRLKSPPLRRALRRFASPQPILPDGRMRPGDWVKTPTTVYKVDYEHHNFGPAELDVVDPAYDLASAIFEFQLDERAEEELVHAYAREAGDKSISHRLLLYKVLSGTRAMEEAAYWAPRAPSEQQRAHWNSRYLAARNFLTYQLHRVCAGLLPPRPQATWLGPLLFLDLDGVFDCEILGFPHTTVSGVAALALLQAQGFAVVLNSGRSVEHVRRYCELYGLPGGVAEYGSVFVDAVEGRERACISPAALEQVQRCREALRGRPGVCVDGDYRYAVRAYRYKGGGTVSLSADELEGLLTQPPFRGLACLTTSADTYFVRQGITKGTAVVAVKRQLGRDQAPAIAIGDSDPDVPMLEAAAAWYAPANCSPRVRQLARSGGGRGRVMPEPRQRGLFQAAQDLVRIRGVLAGDVVRPRQPAPVRTAADLLVALLHTADRPRILRLLAALPVDRL